MDYASDDSDYLRRDDGGHANAWGFSKYMAPEVNKPTDTSDNENDEDAEPILTFKERVDNILKVHGIDMSNETKENARDDTFKHVKP
jgi:hypothetical protein